jgi:asparagine synthase (glutamine-hydrolysing)
MKPHIANALLGRAPSRDPRATAVYDKVTEPYRRCPSTSPVQRAQYADLKIYLPNDVLVKVDRMSMQHSLEVRCPLLDRRLVELAFRFPQSLKQAGRTGKLLLKKVARKRLPAEILDAPKKGFNAPVGAWIAGQYRETFRSEVLASGSCVASLVDLQYARRMFEAHVQGHADHSYALWALWMLERWSRAQRAARPVLSASAEARS